jgi:Holliday junction resolvase-like predicted endonuclease
MTNWSMLTTLSYHKMGQMSMPVRVVRFSLGARRGREYGTSEESITAAKQAKLVEVAQTYLQEHDWPGDWRIDVVAVELTRGGVLERVTVIQNAVGG